MSNSEKIMYQHASKRVRKSLHNLNHKDAKEKRKGYMQTNTINKPEFVKRTDGSVVEYDGP